MGDAIEESSGHFGIAEHGVHKGDHFAGEHDAIVPAELWNAVQAKLKAGAQGTLRSGTAHDRLQLMTAVTERITLHEDHVAMAIGSARLAAALGADQQGLAHNQPILIDLPVVKVRRGHQIRLVIPGPDALMAEPPRRDERLVALIAEAHAARKLVLAHPDRSLNALAAAHGRCRTRLGRLVALSCLAPDIIPIA
ncbi:MAG: hypothetical protein AABZ73_08405 [Pseudomonadota bacterium]